MTKLPPPPEERLDPASIMRVPIVWRPDPAYRFWFEADHGARRVYLRINPEFPDVPLYSLLVAFDETYDFDDLPGPWRRVGAMEWPERGRSNM